MNSCARRKVLELYGKADPAEAVVLDYVLEDDQYRDMMWTTKYCLVLRGSSHTNNVRLYDVMAHGCLPVIITEDFQPALDASLPWRETAVFLRSSEIPILREVLNGISQEDRYERFANLVLRENSFMRVFEWHAGTHWLAMMKEIRRRIDMHLEQDFEHQFKAEQDLGDRGKEEFTQLLENLGCDQCRQWWETPDLRLGSDYFGCADSENLIPGLLLLFNRHKRRLAMDGGHRLPGMLIDGGANVGKTTSKLFGAFGDIPYRELVHERPDRVPCIVCPHDTTLPTVVVVSVEPSVRNFQLLEERAQLNRWDLEGWYAFKGALGDEDGETHLSVIPAFDVDEVATIFPKDGDTRETEPVQVATLETLLAQVRQRFPDTTFGMDREALDGEEGTYGEIFLLKLDIEGAEAKVLLKSAPLLRERGVKFVVFEYSEDTWHSSLAETVNFMWGVGYFCFLMTPDDLFPMSGFFWDRMYILPQWSNVFCGITRDPDFGELIKMYVPKGAADLYSEALDLPHLQTGQ